jgi:hypothetical protein
MTNSTRIFGLFMTLALGAGISLAQGPMLTSSGDDVPPDMQLPLPSSERATPMTTQQQPVYAPASTSSASTNPYAVQNAESYDVPGECAYPDAGGLWNEVAPIESTGTWLRRGFWYAETDALVLTRTWDRNDLRMAAQDPNVNNAPVNQASLGFNPIFLDTNRILILNGALPGQDANVRATLGNFLFRDSRNRDHAIEFTAIGGGTWEQDRQLSSATPNGLFVPFIIDGGNRSFDGSTRQTVQYRSNMDSFEFNYHVRQRLDEDQLIMDPNGNWHRAANSGFQRDYLAGLRFMQVGEKLDWNAQDIVTTGSNGEYLIRTENNMFGFQTGGGLNYQTGRWSFGGRVKGGVFVNDASGHTELTFTSDNADSALRLREDQLSFIGEFGLQSRFQVSPNVSIRAGYEMLLITSQALAPHQATFVTDTSFLDTTGQLFYHGASFGLEWYW